MTATPIDTLVLESRLRRAEDMLEIYNLIAKHPPYADTGATRATRQLWSDDAQFARSDGQGTLTVQEMEGKSVGPEHTAAIEGGLAHFSSHPYVRVDGDTAVAVSYLQLLVPRRDGEAVTVSGHGTSRGYLPVKVVANLWNLVRTPHGWRVHRRQARTLDGTAPPRELLAVALEK